MTADAREEGLARLLYNEQWAGPFCTADGDLLEWSDVADEHRAHFYAEAREVLAWQAARQPETRDKWDAVPAWQAVPHTRDACHD